MKSNTKEKEPDKDKSFKKTSVSAYYADISAGSMIFKGCGWYMCTWLSVQDPGIIWIQRGGPQRHESSKESKFKQSI